jgi:hypothetical protein
LALPAESNLKTYHNLYSIGKNFLHFPAVHFHNIGAYPPLFIAKPMDFWTALVSVPFFLGSATGKPDRPGNMSETGQNVFGLNNLWSFK